MPAGEERELHRLGCRIFSTALLASSMPMRRMTMETIKPEMYSSRP